MSKQVSLKISLTVVYDSNRVGFIKMQEALKKAGYSIEKVQARESTKAVKSNDKTFSTVQFIGVAVILLALFLIINSTVGFNFIPEVTRVHGLRCFVCGRPFNLAALCGDVRRHKYVPVHSKRRRGTRCKSKDQAEPFYIISGASLLIPL